MKTLTYFFLLVMYCQGNQEFFKANNLFAADLYKECKKSSGNFLVSPFSAEVVLALTHSGSKGATAEELKSSLHLPNDEKTKSGIQTFFSKIEQLKNQPQNFYLYSANKIYVKKNLHLKQQFKDVSKNVFYADVESVDFHEKSKTADIINKWVEKQTQNKITNLIDQNDLSDSTAAVLVNSLYLKARWLKEFRPHATKKVDFYRSKNDVIQVDTMHFKERFSEYYESSSLKAKFLKLPFNGINGFLGIILPFEKDGLSELENKGNIFTEHQFERELVNLALPKFKIESKTDVKKILESLGVSKMFTPQADLSGIAGNPGDLTVEKILQKSFIDVNEEGVEAAAATFVLPMLGSGYIQDTPKEFKIDHPFMFYVEVNGAILFTGRVTDPSK